MTISIPWKKTRIADLVPGKIYTIKGKVCASSPNLLVFPPSKTSCVYYAMLEERFGKGARGTGRSLWFPDKMENKSCEFSISDDSGEIVVRETVERLLVKNAHREAGLVRGNRRRRYAASLVKVGDIVVVRGYVDEVSQDENGRFMSAPLNGVMKVKVSRHS